MQTVTRTYKGFSLLIGLNWDRIVTTGTVIGALYAGAYFAQL